MLSLRKGTQFTKSSGEILTLLSVMIIGQHVKYSSSLNPEQVQEMSIKEWGGLDKVEVTPAVDQPGLEQLMDVKFAMMDKSEWQVLEVNEQELTIKSLKTSQTKPFPRAAFTELLEAKQIKLLS